MNRSSKWRRSASEERRPRRSEYHRVYEDDNDKYGIYDSNDNNTYRLLPVQQGQYVEKIIEPGDTLLSLSLQFNCTISELKRINHIIRDNEIFARRIVKVPIKPGSVVTERIAPVHTNGIPKLGENESSTSKTAVVINSARDAFTKNIDVSTSDEEDVLFSTLQNDSCQLSGKSVEVVNSTSNTGPLLDYSASHDSENFPEEIVTSPLLPSEHSSLVTEEVESLKCNGADWGLSWLQLLMCALLLGCAGPVLYMYCITEKKNTN